MLMCQWSRIDDLLAGGLEDLIYLDYEEVESHPESIPLQLDWAYFREQEKAGLYRVISAYVDGVLAGYNAFFMNKSPRSMNTIIAINDVLYLAPEYRKGMNGVTFLKESDRLLKEAGARLIRYGIQVRVRIGARAGDVGSLLYNLGYKQTEIVFTKAL